MNQDYQRIVDKAAELTDMLEALAGKKLAQGRDEEAATLTAIRFQVASLVTFEEPAVVETGKDYRTVSNTPDFFMPTTAGTPDHPEVVFVPRKRTKRDLPPDDLTPEGVPA